MNIPAPTSQDDAGFVEVAGLTKEFSIGRGGVWGKSKRKVHAVTDVSFSISKGETLALVGESGCGKTTVGRLVLRLLEATSGSVSIDGINIGTLEPEAMRTLRRRIQIVIQDPFGSLNPRMTIGAIITEPLEIHGVGNRAERTERLEQLLELVHLPKNFAQRFPHELSGGQRQRVGIARALAIETDFLVCDEAVSALDVSIQAQIINLLQDIKRKRSLTVLFISHDLGVVRHIADKVAVMYLGEIVEIAPRDQLFANPSHPYTQALLASVPRVTPNRRPVAAVLGDVPSPVSPPSGCRFHTRCPHAMDICSQEPPAAREVGAHHHATCHLLEESALRDKRSTK